MKGKLKARWSSSPVAVVPGQSLQRDRGLADQDAGLVVGIGQARQRRMTSWTSGRLPL